jgi:hypothetical protein
LNRNWYFCNKEMRKKRVFLLIRPPQLLNAFLHLIKTRARISYKLFLLSFHDTFNHLRQPTKCFFFFLIIGLFVVYFFNLQSFMFLRILIYLFKKKSSSMLHWVIRHIFHQYFLLLILCVFIYKRIFQY